MNNTIFIIEDETPVLTELRMELGILPINLEWEKSPDKAINKISGGYRPALILFDLVFDGVNRGVDLAKACDAASLSYIVMTSFRSEELYQKMTSLRPEAFYSKPIDFPSLRYQITLFLDKCEKVKLFGGLYVRKRSSIIKINYHDILVLHGEGNYVTIITDTEKFVLRKSLKQLVSELPPKDFIRIHRNYIIRKDKIQHIDLVEVSVHIEDYVLPIGRSYKKDLMAAIK